MTPKINDNTKNKLINIALIFLSVILMTSIFCLTMLTDNKYTISENNEQVFYTNNNLTLLSDDALNHIIPILNWYYYDALLAPSEINNDIYHPKLIEIGEYSNFDTNDTTKNIGTYRATVYSYTEDEYISIALYLPEVMSAYNIYVNGVLIKSMGHVASTSEQYSPYIQNQSLTITFKHTADIVIQVANFSHYYGGIYYPPLIAGVDVMQSYNTTTTVTYSLIFSVAILVALFAFYIYRIKKEKSFLWAGLLSLSFGIYIFYPIIHMIGTKYITLMYSIENFAIMAISVFMLLACTNIMKKSVQIRTINIIIITSCIVVCVLSTFFHTAQVNTFFQVFSLIVRLGIALYIVILALINVLKENKRLITLIASAIYATGLIFDTFVSSYYDPYFFLYPMEIGIFISILLFLFVTLMYNIRIARENKQLNANLINEVTSRTDKMRNLIAERRDFVSSVAHDLKSPITSLSIFTQKLRNEKLTKQEQEKIYEVMQDKLTALSESLTIVQNFNNLDLIDDKLQKVEICKFLRNFCESFEAEAEAEGIYFKYKLPIGLNLYTLIPPQKFERAIQNILFNALSFTHENGNIELRLHATSEKLFIEIQDDGIGMTQEIQEHIFEKFFSYRENAANGQFASDGLGLYYTKLVIEECNGEIAVQSQYEVGTTFIITLPLTNKKEKN